MDIIRKVIETIKVGSITAQWGVLIYRTAKESFVVGETIRVADPRLTTDDAVVRIYELIRQAY